MNQRGVKLLLFLSGAVLLFYFGARWFFSTNDFTGSQSSGSAFSEDTFSAADPDSKLDAGAANEGKEGLTDSEVVLKEAPGLSASALGSGGKTKGPRRLGSENFRLLERCFAPASAKLNIKPSDDLNQVLESLISMDRFERSVEIENIHFNDESGSPLRFQILTENESRFFHVDPEGLPIRIDPPKNLISLKPIAQKEALMNAYRTPVFSESFETYSKANSELNAETPGYSAQIHKINGEVVELQLFYKDPTKGVLRSAGCGGDLDLRCRCL